jgi:hypothetical protein
MYGMKQMTQSGNITVKMKESKKFQTKLNTPLCTTRHKAINAWSHPKFSSGHYVVFGSEVIVFTQLSSYIHYI